MREAGREAEDGVLGVLEVLGWARAEVGCRPEDETCQPVLWCRVCQVDLDPEQVRLVRWGNHLRRHRRSVGAICRRCGSAVLVTPF